MTLLNDVLDERIRVTENGALRLMNKRQAIVAKMSERWRHKQA